MALFQLIRILFFLSFLVGSVAHGNDCIRNSLQFLIKQNTSIKLVPGASDFGPKAFLPARVNSKKLEDISELSIGQFNLENYVETGSRSVVPLDHKYVVDAIENKDGLTFVPALSKPSGKESGVVATIKQADPDVLVVQEIGGLVSLESLNQKLGGQYRSILIPARSAKPGRPVNQVNIGFLVKGDLPFDIEVQSFRNIRKGSSDAPLFSRDLPVVILKEAGTDKPVMAVFGTHFKAMSDEASVALRREQIQMAAKLMASYSERYPSVPMFLVGDYNFDVRIASEFSPLKTSGFKDVFDLAPAEKSLKSENRLTQFFFPGEAKFGQLDAISGNKAVEELKIIKSAEIRPLVNASGEVVPVPKTSAEVGELSSDHAMLKTVIDFRPVREKLKLGQPLIDTPVP